MTGPSPRVRGSRELVHRPVESPGSIPACAGKPDQKGVWRLVARVHPRVCGEAEVSVVDEPGQEGPSPRVRGSRTPTAPATHPPGSIPACAGKPGLPLPHAYREGVHPRVCGEAVRAEGD